MEQVDKKQIELYILKSKLKSMDYKTSKHADGDYTDEQWAAIVAERKELRQKIRELEESL